MLETFGIGGYKIYSGRNPVQLLMIRTAREGKLIGDAAAWRGDE